MKSKQHIFIYNRKEILYFFFIFSLTFMFAFTLGIHFGKTITAPPRPILERSHSTVEDIPDEAPNSHEVSGVEKNTQQKLEGDLKGQLKEEVHESGLKTEQPKQLELPNQAKTRNAGATTLKSHTAHH